MRMHSCRPYWAFMLAVALASSSAALAADEQKATAPAAPSPAVSPEKPRPAEPPARAPRPGDVQMVFMVKISQVEGIGHLLGVFPVAIRTSKNPPAISVSGAPAVVAAVEQAIKRLDVAAPVKDVELTGYVIRGQKKAQGPDDVPEVLSKTVAQMRNLFGFERFQLVEVLVGRSAAEPWSRIELSALGSKPFQAGVAPIYAMSARPGLGSQEGGSPTIRLDELRFTVKVPVEQKTLTSNSPDFVAPRSYSYQDAGVRADIEIRPDQYVVVGKSGLGDDSGDALILVIKARLVD